MHPRKGGPLARHKELEFINWLASGGVCFVVDDGLDAHMILPTDVLAFVANPCAWRARHWGISVEALDRWDLYRARLDWNLPQCGATTKKGRRCRNVTAFGVHNPREFAQLDGAYCWIHAGD
jgi:hypothetical protein